MLDCNSPLTEAEITQYKSAVGQLHWVAEISRPDISFSVCKASTKFKNATVADLYYVNKIIRNVKSTKNCIKFPHLDLKTQQLKLFTDASFNNLPNGGSQGGQITFINDGNNLCPIYWNSSKIKTVVHSTIAAETPSLAHGCDVAIYSLFREEISACAAVHTRCYECMWSYATHNSFASYDGNIICACHANKADRQ